MADQDAVWIDVLPSMKNFFPTLSKSAGDAAEKAGKESGSRFSGSFGKLTGKLGGMLAGAFAGVSVIGVTKSLLAVGSTFNDVQTKIATSTGASGKDLGALVGDVKSMAQQVPTDIGTLTDSMLAVRGSIKSMATASSSELQKTTVSAQAFSQAFEVDITRASQVAGQMITTGMAKNGVDAFDKLTAAAQKVPPALREDLLDAVDEYGPAFKQVGISGDQMMSMLAKSSEKGMFGIDKTGDAIKELGIRMTTQDTNAMAATDTINKFGKVGKLSYDGLAKSFAKGGPEGQKAFSTIVKGLQSIKDPAQKANAAMQMFGTPLEDLNAADIPSFLSGLQSTGKELGNTSGASTKLAQSINSGPQAEFDKLKNNIITGVSPAAAVLFAKLNQGAVWINQNVVPAVNGFVKGWQDFSGAGGEAHQKADALFATLKTGLAFVRQHYTAIKNLAEVLGSVYLGVKAAKIMEASYQAGQRAGIVVARGYIAVKKVLNGTISAAKWVAEKTAMVAHKVATAASTVATRATTVAIRARNLAVKGAGWARDTALMVAHKAATVASTVASRAMAIGQRALNLVMRANPIGLVITALMLLAAGLVYAWKHSETFRRIVTGAWNGIKAAAQAVWGWLKPHVIDKMVLFFGTTLPGAFKKFGDKFTSIWNGIKDAARRPANFVINTIWNNGLRKALNLIPGVNLKEAKAIPAAAMAKGGTMQRGRAAASTRPVLWGEVPGTEEVYIPINGTARSRSLASYAAQKLGMTAMAAGGVVGGSGSWTPLFASEMQAAAAALGRVLQIAQRGFRPRTSYSGTSHAGDAVDVSGPGNLWDIRDALRKVGIYSWVRGPLQGYSWHVHGIPAPGHGTAAGSAVYQQSAYAAGGDGLHGMTTPDVYRVRGTQVGIGGGSDSSGSSLLTQIPSLISGLKDKVAKGLTSPWGRLFATGVTSLIDKAKTWALDKVKGLFSGVIGKLTGGTIERWRPTIAQALRMTGIGGGKADEDLWLAQVKTESDGNAHATQGVKDVNSGGNEAYGLLQVIPGTFAQYRAKSLPNDRGNPLANSYAGMNYAGHRYGIPGWRRVIGKGHGYQHGTGSADPGLSFLSENGMVELITSPQARVMHGGERVYNSAQTRRILGGSSGGNQPAVFNIYDTDGFFEGKIYGTAQGNFEDNMDRLARIGA